MSTNPPEPNPITRLLELIVREAEGFSEASRNDANALLTEILGGAKAPKTPTTPLEIAVEKARVAKAELDALNAEEASKAKVATDAAAAQAAIDQQAAAIVAAEANTTASA